MNKNRERRLDDLAILHQTFARQIADLQAAQKHVSRRIVKEMLKPGAVCRQLATLSGAQIDVTQHARRKWCTDKLQAKLGADAFSVLCPNTPDNARLLAFRKQHAHLPFARVLDKCCEITTTEVLKVTPKKGRNKCRK